MKKRGGGRKTENKREQRRKIEEKPERVTET